MLHRFSRLAPPVPHDHVETFFAADWRVASTIGTPSCLAGIVSQTRVESSYRKGSSFTTSASEFLLAYPVFHYFLVRVVTPRYDLGKPFESFEALGVVLHSMNSAKRGPIDGDVVDAECSTSMSSFVESHGKNRVKPKRHYQMHIPAQIRRDRGRLWDAFAGERKNKAVLAMAENMRNTKTFERSVLQTLIASTFQKLCQDDALSQKLLKPARPAECLVGLLPEWGSVVPTISNAAHISGRKICIGELVVPNGERDAFLIHACVSAHSWFGVIAERCAFVESVSRFAKRFKRCNRISVVRLEGFVAVDIWYYPDVSEIVTLWP